MRRTKLIWFALGAAASGLVTTAVALLLAGSEGSTEPENVAFLVVQEPFDLYSQDETENADFIANETGEMARECGAEFFETTFLYNDHGPTMDLPLISENADSFTCIIEQISERGLTIDIQIRKATNAQAF